MKKEILLFFSNYNIYYSFFPKEDIKLVMKFGNDSLLGLEATTPNYFNNGSGSLDHITIYFPSVSISIVRLSVAYVITPYFFNLLTTL